MCSHDHIKITAKLYNNQLGEPTEIAKWKSYNQDHTEEATLGLVRERQEMSWPHIYLRQLRTQKDISATKVPPEEEGI